MSNMVQVPTKLAVSLGDDAQANARSRGQTVPACRPPAPYRPPAASTSDPMFLLLCAGWKEPRQEVRYTQGVPWLKALSSSSLVTAAIAPTEVCT